MEIGITILGYLLPVIATVLTLFAIAGIRKLLDKFGIDRSDKLDGMIDKYVRMGINAAEVAGENYFKAHNVKMGGLTKRAQAVQTVMNELKQSGVTDVAEELIVDRIEHWLFEEKKLTI